MSHDQQVIVELREEIEQFGVAICAGEIEACEAGMQVRRWSTHYTVGLTRHEGHPEVIAVDMCCDCAERVLSAVSDVVSGGARLGPGWGLQIDGWDYLLIDVDDPTLLPEAQALYRRPEGPVVPALQVIGTDEEGGFPWESGIGADSLLGPVPRALWA